MRGVVTTFHDISAQHTAERESHEREHLYRTLAENTPDLIVRFDRSLRRVFVNHVAAEIAGRTEAELIGTQIGTHYVPSTEVTALPQIVAQVREVLASGEPVQLQMKMQTANGARTSDLRLVPERDASGRVASVLGVGRDVTQFQRAVEAARASEGRLRQVTENIDEVFWLIDASRGNVAYISPAYARVYGADAELLRRNPRAWLDVVHPADLASVEAAMGRAADSSEIEYRIRRGAETRWIRHRWFPIHDEDGHAQRIAAVSEDVTRRRELEAELRQAQKMDAIGKLAGGIAHDFNNILAVVQLQAGALAADAHDNPVQREGLEEIGFAASRAAHLTQQLLTFSRR